MRTATVQIDGKDYTINELRHRPNKQWRQELFSLLASVTEAIEGAKETEITDVQAMSRLIQVVGKAVIDSPDTMSGLVVKYAPKLADVVEEGYDSEITDAFVEVLKLAYPFSKALDTLKKLGSELPQTKRS